MDFCIFAGQLQSLRYKVHLPPSGKSIQYHNISNASQINGCIGEINGGRGVMAPVHHRKNQIF